MPLGLISLLGGLKSIGSAVVSFLGKLNIWQLGCIVLALIATVQTLRLHAEQRHSTKLSEQVAKCDAARRADRQSYVTAQQQAQAANKAQVQKIEQQYQRNSDNEREAYLSDLAKLRAGRVRPQASTPASPSGPTGAPAPSGPSGGIDGSGEVRLSSEEFLRAQEIELQLMHLENWVREQTSIDPNK